MVSNKKKKSRGAILGLALTAMLAFGVLGAGAAQAATWSIGGTAFHGEEEFASKSAAPFSIQFWGSKFDCDQTANGTMSGGDEGSAIVSFSNCKSSWAACQMQALTTQKLRVDLVEAKGFAYEKFSPASGTIIGEVTLTGATCPVANSWPLTGSFAGWFNPKQTLPSSKPALRFNGEVQSKSGSALKIGTEPVVLTGDSQQWLTGANAGSTWWWVP